LSVQGDDDHRRLRTFPTRRSSDLCHDVMDALGLALENFDAIGAFRLRDSDAGNVPIDASGQLADGTPLQGVNDLREALVARPEQDRKSTRLNSSHVNSSYAVFCLK